VLRRQRSGIDWFLRGLAVFAVFWAGAAFALGSIVFVALLITAACAWGCSE
jgi:hypothetical protein